MILDRQAEVTFKVKFNCIFLIVLCILYVTVTTAEDIPAYTGNVTHDSNEVTSLTVNDNTGTTEQFQNFTSSTTLTPISTTSVGGDNIPKARVQSPWDHITNFFNDFKSQVIALNLEYCGHTCNFTHKLRAKFKNINCDECSCHKMCQETGDCCPDLVLLHNRTRNPVYPGCIEADLPLTKFTKFYLMVNWCPASYNISFIKTHCENPPLTDWLNVVPRVNQDTWTSFRNIYCAECNGQNNTSNWATSITCSSFDSKLQKSTSLLGLFNAIMVSNTCAVHFKLPSDLAKRPCGQRVGEVIERCNVTGLWLAYDKKVEDACRAFSQVVFGTYRNIFCFYCNNQYSWEYVLTTKGGFGIKNPMTVSLTTLIDFDNTLAYRHSDHSPDIEGYSNGNSTGSMVSYLKQCQNLSVTCAEGKQLNGDECHSLFAASNMYGYRVCFQVNITLTKPLTTTDLEMLIYYNFPQVNHRGIDITNMTGYVVDIQNCPHKQMYLTLRYVVFIYSVLTQNRDQFEKQLMEDNTMILTDSTDHVQYHAGCSSRPALALTRGDAQHCTLQFHQFVVKIPVAITEYQKKIAVGAKYIQLSKQLNCPRIVLDSSDYIINLHNTSYMAENIQFPTLFVLSSQTVVEHQKFQALDDGSVVVCVSDYMAATSHTTYSCNDEHHVTGTMHLGIFSFVCTSISLLFLAVTFGTYCMFASMRTLGGVCNMGLIATLFAAQAMFEFGIEQNEDAIGCQVIGIIIHFLWLAAVFWMNASTFLLFLKLSFPLKCRNIGFNLKKTFLLSALYSNGTSAVMVCTNVIINIASRGDIGYGGTVCYLNTNFSIVYFFKFPMGIIVMVNIGLFVFTVCRISHHESISSTRESKLNLLACVKLSVITGLVWLFSYLYEVFQITAFAYVFTLFVGSQGVLFFIAIVINKNVLSLWSSYFGRRKSKILTSYRKSNNTTSSDSLTGFSNMSLSDSYELAGTSSKTGKTI